MYLRLYCIEYRGRNVQCRICRGGYMISKGRGGGGPDNC